MIRLTIHRATDFPGDDAYRAFALGHSGTTFEEEEQREASSTGISGSCGEKMPRNRGDSRCASRFYVFSIILEANFGAENHDSLLILLIS